MKGGLGNIMKQAQKMQADMMQAQEELAQIEVTGESGAGMVQIVMTGKHEIRRIKIDDELLGDDKDMLEDMIAAAFNDAVHKVEATTKDKMSGLSAGLPAGLNLPF